MDRPNANEGGYRELLGLSHNNTTSTAVIAANDPISPKPSKSSSSPRHGNDPGHAFLDFPESYMSATDERNASVNTLEKATEAQNPRLSSARIQVVSRACRSHDSETEDPQARARPSGHSVASGGTIDRTGLSEGVPTATRRSDLHDVRGSRGRGDAHKRDPPVASAFGGRGRVFDISHVRGRGRGGSGDTRHRIKEQRFERDGVRNFELDQRNQRGGGRDGHRGRFARGGRGRGAMEYDADFDRGKTIQDRRAESQKQLFQAPMGYKSGNSTEPAERKGEQGPRKEEVKEAARREFAHTKQAEGDFYISEEDMDKKLQPAGLLDIQEVTARPGLIKTGIDVTAAHSDSRKGKHAGERRDKDKRREDRERRSARDASRGLESDRDNHGRVSEANAPTGHRSRPNKLVSEGPTAPPHLMEGSLRAMYPSFPPRSHEDSHGRPPHDPPTSPSREEWYILPHSSPPVRHSGPPPLPPISHDQGSGGRHDRRKKPGDLPEIAREQGGTLIRDVPSRHSQERDINSVGSPVPPARQLFDPLRHDPVKFAANRSTSVPSSEKLASGIETRSLASSITRSSLSSLPAASANDRSRYITENDALLAEIESAYSGACDTSLLHGLEATYREILKMETKLQDEDSFTETAMEQEDKSIGRSDPKQWIEVRSDEHWAKLTRLHREIAEAFYSLMEGCMHPLVPESVHLIPQKYDLPGRMWKTAFSSLLERLQLATSTCISSDTCRTSTPDPAAKRGQPENGSAFEHLTDFVYYAYTFYTQLFGQQCLAGLRGVWIEHLGDIARYCMSLTEISSKMPHSASAVAPDSQGKLLQSLLEGTNGNETSNSEIPERTPKKQLMSRKDRKKGFPGIPAKLDEGLELAETPGNSIGAAALNDWDLDEVDIWRTTSQEWYFLGLHETPGIGRLHHHLAILCEEDELRALYHLSKSLTASQPYSAGSDDMKAFFSPEKQAARLQSGVAVSSLFVHLHGLLYTGLDLDSFDAILARLERKLEDTFTYAESQAGRPPKRSVRGKQREDSSQRVIRDSMWIMMGVINTAAILEYGKDEGMWKSALMQAHDAARTEKNFGRGGQRALHRNRNDPTPSEASLTDLARQVERLGMEASRARSSSRQPDPVPPPISRQCRLALHFAFRLLEHSIAHPLNPGESHPAICPYITTLLTFLSTLVAGSTGLAIIRSEVPWEAIMHFLDSLPDYARNLYLREEGNVRNRLLGNVLPEDWCVRGLAWTNKELFGRGSTRGKHGIAHMSISHSEPRGITGDQQSHGYTMPESEKDVLTEVYERPSMPAHAGGPLVPFQASGGSDDDGDLDEDGRAPTERDTVARLRWKRVALIAVELARAIPFISIDRERGRLFLVTELYTAAAKQDAQREAQNSEATSTWTSKALISHDKFQGTASKPDDDDILMGSGGEGATAKELSLLRQSREDGNGEKQQPSVPRSAEDGLNRRVGRSKTVNALAGYTTFVLDTNVLLEDMDVFTVLLTSKRWTLVVPLIVVTELDGLRSKEDRLGTSANQAIKFLEDAIKTYNMNLKIQTSKGNYLRDLNIRREDIDFGQSAGSGTMGVDGKNGGAAKDSNSIKTMDDVILNVAIWQKTHWLDRRAVLGIKSTESNETSTSTPVKTILVSSDRTLRLKGKARGLEVCDAAAVRQLLEQPPAG